jgi:nickel-dependent lactate racemase
MAIICDLPYGNGFIPINLPVDQYQIDLIYPQKLLSNSSDNSRLVQEAIESPLGCKFPFSSLPSDTQIAIVVNDKTRPVPNTELVFPLLQFLHENNIQKSNIHFFVASGTHLPMTAEELPLVLGNEIPNTYPVHIHDCDQKDNLCEIGITSRGTPVYVNRQFYESNIKIVVGDIELHHFAGFSGGVKSAAIGMSGRSTINHNHKLLLDPKSALGEYEQNPLRQDIEEIGQLMEVQFALNAVIDEHKHLISVFFGDPKTVMREGIRVVRKLSQIEIEQPYDLVIASAGGYPKDINLYQAQKAMTHASLFCKPGGLIVLAAECREGAGSEGFLNFMNNVNDLADIFTEFAAREFSVGPHKAFQIARILERNPVYLHASLNPELTSRLFLTPIDLFSNNFNDLIQSHVPPDGRIAILPYATACIPSFIGKKL